MGGTRETVNMVIEPTVLPAKLHSPLQSVQC